MTVRTVVVDTNVFAAALGNDPNGLLHGYAADLVGARLVISFQTVAELRYGALKARWGSRRVGDMEDRMGRAVVIPPHNQLPSEWASLRNECRHAGHPLHGKIHHADLWIAATARLARAPLVTHDTVFRDAPGLTVICRA